MRKTSRTKRKCRWEFGRRRRSKLSRGWKTAKPSSSKATSLCRTERRLKLRRMKRKRKKRTKQCKLKTEKCKFSNSDHSDFRFTQAIKIEIHPADIPNQLSCFNLHFSIFTFQFAKPLKS